MITLSDRELHFCNETALKQDGTIEFEQLNTAGNLASISANILKNRGIGDNETISSSFLNPSIHDLHDPFLFPQMKEAVNRVLKAKELGERVVIFGDYDVDGVSSTAMLVRFFTQIGMAVSYRLPHRVKDGYGMKSYFFDELAQKQVKLVISVDCGTRDIEVIRYAKSLGIDVIVTDHHAVPEIIPEEAVAIISPKLPETTYPFHGLSGSGTAFKLLSAVASTLYNGAKLDEILLSYIDFAALGTVADMVPLIGENRVLVKLGLKQLSDSKSPGLRKMLIGKNTESADVIGFHIGPRINAAGRMESAETALKMLLVGDTQVDGLLSQIEDLNIRRRAATEKFIELSMQQVNSNRPVIFFESEDIEHGVIGLVAGRLAEHFSRPAIVCTQHNGKYIGSARSPENLHITNALESMRELFFSFGGHGQAAGFTLSDENYNNFQERMCDYVNSVSGGVVAETRKSLSIDAMLTLETISLDLIQVLAGLGPYGMNYRKPLFLLILESLPHWSYLGEGQKHIKFDAPKGYKLIGFGLGNLAPKLNTVNGRVGLVVELDTETWQGRVSIAVQIRDIVELT